MHPLPAATGFTDTNLRFWIAGLLGSTYTARQMTYDLRRLRLAGPIQRLPHTNRYIVTDGGLHQRLLLTSSTFGYSSHSVPPINRKHHPDSARQRPQPTVTSTNASLSLPRFPGTPGSRPAFPERSLERMLAALL